MRTVIAGVALCVALAAAPSAGAQSPRSHPLRVTWTATPQAKGNPRTVTGVTAGTLGRGAVVYTIAYTGPRFHLVGTVFNGGGLVHFVVDGANEAGVGPTAQLRGSGSLTGGTGPYRHARGALKLIAIGSVSADGTAVNRATVTGTLSR